jgi:hypothetical protein
MAFLYLGFQSGPEDLVNAMTAQAKGFLLVKRAGTRKLFLKIDFRPAI